MNISDADAAAVEAAVAAFAPDLDFATALGRLCSAATRYEMVQAEQDPDLENRALAQLQRVSPGRYSTLVNSFSPARRQSVAAFVAQYAGTALPGRPVLQTLTTLRATPPVIKPGGRVTPVT